MGSNCPEIALGCPGVPSEITDRAGQHFAGEPTLDVEVMNALLLLIVLGFLLALERRTLPPKDQMKRPSLLCCYQLVMSLDLPGNLVPVPLRLFRYCCSPLVGTPIQKELSCGRCRLSSPQIIYVCLSVSRNSLRSSQVRQETLLQVRPPVVQVDWLLRACAVYGASSALHVVGSFRARTIWETLRKISPPT